MWSVAAMGGSWQLYSPLHIGHVISLQALAEGVLSSLLPVQKGSGAGGEEHSNALILLSH